FGNPAALALAASTLQDDAALLDRLDASRDSYRAALVIRPRAVPPPGAAGASLAALTGGEASSYHPGEHGDVFVLRRALDWGGLPLETGQVITVDVVDTARYHRDLGLLLRPVHDNLLGWDTVGLPAPEPALGMSREAFVDYLRGASPSPVPEPEVTWGSPALARVAVANRTAQGSAIASTANWVELQFTGTEVLDVQLGEFSGAEYLRQEGGAMRRTVARDATAVRLFLTYVPPRARVSGGAVRFLAPPRSLATRWGVRLGDGSEASGGLQPVPLAKGR
ncbi:MAG TPA: hypothetical protein VLW17_02440, partial [Thermoanaerobaculaceae bacterium]|nr:hypothetical protein [Thermoanaerobaculaceae bacterium]